MRIKQNLIIRQVADTWVVLPIGDNVLDFNGILSLNETGAMLWQLLEKECNKEALATALTNEYKVSFEQALADVEEFLEILSKAGCLL